MIKKLPKVFVLMSGGVDSSVAALLLKKTGKCEVLGAHLISFRDKCSKFQTEATYAVLNAEKIGIPLYIFDFEKEYRQKVFNYMIREYAKGKTPNPDVMCNSQIKFGLFLEKALEMGADYVATGHYVRKSKVKSQKSKTTHKLLRAKDNNKDQSYFLWTLTQNQLKHCLFPLGNYLKSEVREIAKKYNLPSAQKPDSQGLCFVGKTDFADFLGKYLPKNPGQILDFSGKTIGVHSGLQFYTLGQRQGLKLGGSPAPLYVADKIAAANTLIVAPKRETKALYKSEIETENLNWISGLPPSFPLKCEVVIRYRQKSVVCQITQIDENRVRAKFAEPLFAPASGQSAVFYAKSELLGGGVIV